MYLYKRKLECKDSQTKRVLYTMCTIEALIILGLLAYIAYKRYKEWKEEREYNRKMGHILFGKQNETNEKLSKVMMKTMMTEDTKAEGRLTELTTSL